MSRTLYKRVWFFDSPPNDTGDKFVRRNIPTQEVYSKLLESIAFLSEISDQGTEIQQGLFKVYTDEAAIDARGDGIIKSGNRKVLKASQPPSVSILDNDLELQESHPDGTGRSGPYVSNNGIKISGRMFDNGTVKRTTYELQFDASTFEQIPAVSADTFFYIMFDQTNGKHYLAPTERAPGSSKPAYTHDQPALANIWTVIHNMGYKPAIGVEVGVPGAYETAKTAYHHIDDNSLEVTFNSQQIGRVLCS